MTRIEELRIQAAAAVEAAAAAVAEQVEVITLTAAIDRANNTTLQAAAANASISETTTTRLKTIEASCEAIVASMPVYNSKTRENRKWTPRREYGLGLHIQALSGILSGIQYSTAQHKQQLLALIPGISEDLIESTLEAFGQTSYYSRNYNIIVPEVPANLTKLLTNLDLIESSINKSNLDPAKAISLDLSRLTPQFVEHKFELARLKAAKDQADEEAKITLQAQKVAI